MAKTKTKTVFSETIVWKGSKYLIEFVDSDVFPKLKEISQVYGFIFDDKDRLLIVKCGADSWSLPGGGPEKCDRNWKDTLIRETEEEANAEISDIKPAGYIISTSLDNKPKHKTGIMLRAVARLKKLNPRKIDPAHGTIAKRKLIKKSEFLKYLKWHKNGIVQLKYAESRLKNSIKTK
jgi:8-oxo-dGTP pyrophosphatase MutT (NUDIX family)